MLNIIMVSPLKYYKKDPMGKKRGPGNYYKRSYKGNKKYYSKYTEEADMKRKSKKTRYRGGSYRHAGDNGSYEGYKKRNKRL